MRLGANGTQTQNNGRVFITLKPRNQRGVSADEVIRRLRPQLAKVEGAALFLQAAQDINIGGRPQLIDDTLYKAFGQRPATPYFTQLNSYSMSLVGLADTPR